MFFVSLICFWERYSKIFHFTHVHVEIELSYCVNVEDFSFSVNGLGTLIENQLVIGVCVYFCTLNYIAIGKSKSCNYIFIFQDCFEYTGCLQIHKNLRIRISISGEKKMLWNFDRDCIQFIDQFW